MNECLFCRLIDGRLPSKKVLESDSYVVIHDIRPKAPTHLLIIPKRHCERPSQLNKDELFELFEATETIASKLQLNPPDFKLQFNVGKHAGQEIDHVHLHLLSNARSSTSSQ